MSENSSPHYFFSEAEVLQRVFIVYGNLSDNYFTPHAHWLSFECAVAAHLKHQGYRAVIFFNGTEKLECFDQESADIRREKFKKTEWEQQKEKLSKRRGTAEKPGEDKPQSSSMFTLMKRHNPEPQEDGNPAAGEQQTPENEEKKAAPDDLRFSEKAERVPEYLDEIMRNQSVKTALIFCNCASLFDGHREEGKSVSAREIANRMSRWYSLPAENQNIAVMLFDIPRIVTLRDTMRSQQMWNFLFERAFNDDTPTDAVLYVGGPKLDEIKYLLREKLPGYVNSKALRKINPAYSRQALENAAQLLVQQNHGSLKSLLLFISQHPENPAEALMEQYGGAQENALERIREMEGWEAVYEGVSRIINSDRTIRGNISAKSALPLAKDTNLRMAYDQDMGASSANLSMLLCGSPGTGKTTAVKYIASAFKQAGLLPSDQVFKVTRADLVGRYIGETAQKTRAWIERAMGAVLFVDEAYSLYREGHDGGEGSRDFGIEAIDTLLPAMTDLRGRISIIFAGYPKDMKYFLTANAGLPRRLDGNIITIQDYKPDVLERIFLRYIAQMNQISKEDSIPEDIAFFISGPLGASTSGAMEPLAFIEKDRADRAGNTLSPVSVFFDNWYADRDKESFGNAGAAEELARHVTESAQRRTGIENGNISIEQCDFGEEYQKFFINRKPSLKELDAQLQDIVGMENVKEELHNIVSYLQTTRMRESVNHNPDLAAEPGHYLFVGNPGTGKTLIAEKLGMALCSMGMIQRYKPVRKTGLDLMNTVTLSGGIRRLKEEIESYNRGVLVIDEAHQLSDPATVGAGSTVIKCLLDPMIEHKKEFCVIFCCYPQYLKRFLQVEEGLSRRISRIFNFKNYEPEEICEIFKLKARKLGYDVESEGVLEAVLQAFQEMQASHLLENGASAEKMLKEIEVSMGIRLLDSDFSQSTGLDSAQEKEIQSRLFTVERQDVEAAADRMITILSEKNGGVS